LKNPKTMNNPLYTLAMKRAMYKSCIKQLDESIQLNAKPTVLLYKVKLNNLGYAVLARRLLSSAVKQFYGRLSRCWIRYSKRVSSEPVFLNVYGAPELIQGMNSASLCSLAGRYDKPIPPRFLASRRLFKNSSSDQVVSGSLSFSGNKDKNMISVQQSFVETVQLD
jgi:hypothetical protein